MHQIPIVQTLLCVLTAALLAVVGQIHPVKGSSAEPFLMTLAGILVGAVTFQRPGVGRDRTGNTPSSPPRAVSRPPAAKP